MNHHSIITETDGQVAYIWLNRPGLRNALDGNLLEEFLDAFERFNQDPFLRIINVRGKGPCFCAGADLGWMQKAKKLSEDENVRQTKLLARCFHALFTSNKITVASVHGAALGGGMGILSACDLAIAAETAVFAFSEVKLGLIPATVAPYVLQKTRSARIMEYLLTGKKFSGHEAFYLGIINRCVKEEKFEQANQDLIGELLTAAPLAQQSIKKLMRSLTGMLPDQSTIDRTAFLLAETRVSEEAEEGMRAFLDKRQPAWMVSEEEKKLY
jgi:methylglutaconyl-CoA hydratase